MSWLPSVLALALCAGLVARLRRTRQLALQASHELRGPLTAAGLALETLVRSGGLAADGAEAVAAQLRRARLALDDLAAAPAATRAPDVAEPIGVAGFVAALALAWRPVAAARGVELRLGPLPSGVVVGDRVRLAQAAGNLLSNAFEHGHGVVELRARVAGGVLRLEVRDGGPGLPAPVEDLLRRRSSGAHGHGLVVASGIAARHGGRLVAAPSPRGAAVVLELPLAVAA